jgi:hypothetical protein
MFSLLLAASVLTDAPLMHITPKLQEPLPFRPGYWHHITYSYHVTSNVLHIMYYVIYGEHIIATDQSFF